MVSTVAEWLQSLGVPEYTQRFAENGIEVDVLPELTDQDLEKLGVLLGHRRKMLRSIRDLAGAPAASLANAPIASALTEAKPDAAERRQLTVMFCDLVGSTELSARLDPEDLREIIGVYHRCVAETVARFDGFVAKYMGDGVLVYFGYPLAHEDDAERAVTAGLALVSAVQQLRPPSAERLNIRVGIAAGLAVVGDLTGVGAAQEEAVIGETPNLAARLQNIAEPGTLVIDSGMRRLVGNLFEMGDLGSIRVKGFPEPVQVYRVLGPSGIENRFEALHGAAPLTPLVGRDEEVELLLRRWLRAKGGQGQAVLISGEPGIGKSRLTAALQERLANEPHTSLRCFCSPHRQDSPLRPFIAQLERAAGFSGDDTPSARLAKLEALLAPTACPDEDVALIADLLSVPRTERCHPALDGLTPQRKKERTFQALIRQVEALARLNCVLVVFEDVHWADPTSRELLDLIIERTPPLSLMLVVTFRPEFQPAWVGAHVTTLSLTRLDRHGGTAIVEGVAGKDRLSDATIAEIVDRTDGVPLFVEELAKAVLEAGGRDRDGNVILAKAGSASPTVPATLHASLMARLDRLGAAAKEVAQVGAAVGREFSYELAAAVAGRSDADLRAALDKLTDAGLVFRRGTPPDAVFLFKHALVQEVAYGTALRDRRRGIHAKIAKVLEERSPETRDTQPEVLAHHFARAGEHGRALTYWTKAGDIAELRAASREAAAHYRAALGLAEDPTAPADVRERRPELLMKLGNALVKAEGYSSPSGRDAYRQAAKLAGESGQVETEARAIAGVVPLLFFTEGHYREALRVLTEVSSKSGSISPPTKVSLLMMLGVSSIAMGEYGKAIEYCETAISLDDTVQCTHSNPVAGTDPAVFARGYLNIAANFLGQFDRVLVPAVDALALARRRNHSYTVCWALQAVGQGYLFLGRPGDALAACEEAIPIAESHGFDHRLGALLMVQGIAYCHRGEIDKGLPIVQFAIARWRSFMGRFHLTWQSSELVELLLRAGKFDHADTVLKEAEQVQAETDERSHSAELHRFRALILMQQGRHEEATAHLCNALGCSREQGAKLFELRALRDLSRHAASLDLRHKARGELEVLLSTFPSGFSTRDLAEAASLVQGDDAGSV